MKLSEAIKLGAMLGPQGHNVLRRGEALCALGAAAVASGIKVMDEGRADADAYDALQQRYPLLMTFVDPPLQLEAPDRERFDLSEVIWSLNDISRWTREQIADWVETVEAQVEAEQPEVCEVAVQR